MDLGGCGGVLSNGFLIHILRPELPVSVCTGVCLLYLFIPPIVSSTVESSSVQLRTRWNVPQCTNMGCAALLPPNPSIKANSFSFSPSPFAICHPPSEPGLDSFGRLKRNCVGKLYPRETRPIMWNSCLQQPPQTLSPR